MSQAFIIIILFIGYLLACKSISERLKLRYKDRTSPSLRWLKQGVSMKPLQLIAIEVLIATSHLFLDVTIKHKQHYTSQMTFVHDMYL